MAIKLTDTVNQAISWGALSSVLNLTDRTWSSWVKWNAYPARVGATFTLLPLDAAAEWCGWHYVHTTNTISLFIKWSTTTGVWTIAKPTVGTIHHMAFTYNNSSVSNNPIVYVDGAPVTVTRATAPVGTYNNGANVNMQLGASDGTNVADANINSFCIYNHIASASEIADWHASRKFIPSRNNLVFAPRLNGAAGGVKDGDTLGSTNYITDLVSGARGTPSGSPVILADNYLRGE